MNKASFRTYVSARRPPGVSQEGLEEAIDHCYASGWLDRRNVYECARECISLAQRFDIYVAQKRPQSDTATSQHMPMTPPDRMMSDDFAERIRPAVEQLRSELFGSPAPPFPEYADAAQWLDQTAAEQDAYAQAKSQTRIALEGSIHEKLEEYQVLTGEGYQSPFLLNLLEYAKLGSDWVHSVNVWGGTSLATLANTSRKLVDTTGFSQASVVAYVLAGIRPLLASVSIGMSCGYSNEFNIFRGSVTIALHSPYVADAQWREIRKFILRAWGTEKKKPLTEGNKQLLNIVQRHGGVPKDKGHGEHKTFFEQVRQEYNLWAVEHKCKPHKDWRVTRNAYERLLKKTQQGAPCIQEALY